MDLDTVLGIAMIVLGVLVFVGEFTVGWLLPVIGLALIVMGVLMLLGVLAGGTLIGVLTLVAGLLLYAGFLDPPAIVTQSINTVVGIVLIVLGVLQLT